MFSCLAEWKVTQDHFIPLMMLEGENVNPKIFGAVSIWPTRQPINCSSRDPGSAYLAAGGCQDCPVPPANPEFQGRICIFKGNISSNYAPSHGRPCCQSTVSQALPVLTASRSRSERQEANLRLLLLLVRNIVCIRDGASGINMTTETVLRSNLQERIVERMHNEQMLEMLMAFTGSMDQGSGFTDWNVIILEIVHYILGDRDPAQILNGPQYSAGVCCLINLDFCRMLLKSLSRRVVARAPQAPLPDTQGLEDALPWLARTENAWLHIIACPTWSAFSGRWTLARSKNRSRSGQNTERRCTSRLSLSMGARPFARLLWEYWRTALMASFLDC